MHRTFKQSLLLLYASDLSFGELQSLFELFDVVDVLFYSWQKAVRRNATKDY